MQMRRLYSALYVRLLDSIFSRFQKDISAQICWRFFPFAFRADRTREMSNDPDLFFPFQNGDNCFGNDLFDRNCNSLSDRSLILLFFLLFFFCALPDGSTALARSEERLSSAAPSSCFHFLFSSTEWDLSLPLLFRKKEGFCSFVSIL